jgi:prophage tail gpP-like protein
MNDVSVVIANQRYTDWGEFDLARSVDSGIWRMNLDISGPWRSGNHRRIKQGQDAQIVLGSEALLTGVVHRRNGRFGPTDHSVKIEIQSFTKDLVECTLAGRTVTDQTLYQVAVALCKPFGITVIDVAKQDEPFKGQLVLNEGESPWQFLEQLARSRGVRLMPSPGKELYIVQAGAERSDTPLILGDNIVEGDIDFNESTRFSEVLVLSGDMPNDDPFAPADVGPPMGEAYDATVARYRPLTIVAHDPLDHKGCKARADWQVRTQAGRDDSIVYELDGFTQENGESWLPNLRVDVFDPYNDIDGERLITETRLMRSETDGDVTKLRVMPPEALERTRLADPVKQEEGFL